jgi:hypothetical protein
MSGSKGGRPSKFKPEFVEQARKLAALGATDREAAEFFGVDEATLYRWKHTQPQLCEALKIGKDTADARVEQSLYRRAVGYQHDDVHFSAYEGAVTATPYVKHYPPDTVAAIFWLKNRQRDQWRDVKVVEASGPGGGPILVDELAGFTAEDRTALRAALKAATETQAEKNLRMLRDG